MLNLLICGNVAKGEQALKIAQFGSKTKPKILSLLAKFSMPMRWNRRSGLVECPITHARFAFGIVPPLCIGHDADDTDTGAGIIRGGRIAD